MYEYNFRGSKVRSTIAGRIEQAQSFSAGLFSGPSVAPSGRGDQPFAWLSEFREDADSSAGSGVSSSRSQKAHEYLSDGSSDSEDGSGTLSRALLQQASLRLSAYLHAERERYYPEGRVLNDNAKAQYARFFSQELLDKVRVLVLSGCRVASPSFFAEENGLAAVDFPNFAHKASVTFLDVIVFNERITERELFKALVHAAQAHVFGPQAYAEHYVRGVLQSRSYSLAPMEAQSFALAGRFSGHPDLPFSVEDEIRSTFNFR